MIFASFSLFLNNLLSIVRNSIYLWQSFAETDWYDDGEDKKLGGKDS